MASLKFKDKNGNWQKVGFGSAEATTAAKVSISPTSSNVLGMPSGSTVDAALQKLGTTKAPAYTYGTEDVVEGSASPYEDGHVHFIYEP